MARQREEFNFEALQAYDDGRISASVNEELQRTFLDMENRPADSRPREVVIKLKFTPVRDPDDGTLEGSSFDFECNSRTPARKSNTYKLGATRGGHMFYNVNNPDEFEQMSIDDQINRKAAE